MDGKWCFIKARQQEPSSSAKLAIPSGVHALFAGQIGKAETSFDFLGVKLPLIYPSPNFLVKNVGCLLGIRLEVRG